MNNARDDLMSITEGLVTNHLGYLSVVLHQKYPDIEFGFTDEDGRNSLFWLEEGSCFDVSRNAESFPRIESNSSNYDEKTHRLFFGIRQGDVGFFVFLASIYAFLQLAVVRRRKIFRINARLPRSHEKTLCYRAKVRPQ